MSEAAYYDALKRITRFQTVEQIRRNAEKQYGLEPVEALEYAYENVIQEARDAIRGKRRPKESTSEPRTTR